MSSTSQGLPLFLRFAVWAAAVGIVGWFTSLFGPSFVDSGTRAELSDNVSAIGSALMSASSLICLLVIVLTVTDSLQNHKITWAHVITLLFAGCVTIAAGIDGAYPR